jgi:predicted nucleic acid-binding protein
LCAAIGAGNAGTALDNLVSLNIPTIDSQPFLKLTLGIATLYRRSVYDSVYVALAHTEGAEFVTADEKLANAVSARLPVRWIGSL